MYKKSLILVLLLTVIFTFIGCSSKSIAVNKSESEIMADKNKAYVVFARPAILLGGTWNAIDIIHFDNKNFDMEFVASLSTDEKIIYKIEAGDNYFYTTSNSISDHIFDNIQKIHAKSGQIYYISLGLSNGFINRFPSVSYTKDRISFVENLQKKECSKIFLNRYLFKEELTTEKEEIQLTTSTAKPIVEYKSIINVNVFCQDDKIVDLIDTYQNYSLKELNHSPLIMPSKTALAYFKKNKEEYRNGLKDFYKTWHKRFKNIPMTRDIYLDIKKDVNEKYFKQFSGVNVVSFKNEKIENNIIQDMTNSLQSIFIQSNVGKILTMQYHINVFSDVDRLSMYINGLTLFGSKQAKRDIQSNVGTIYIDIVFKDEHNNTIGNISVSGLKWGFGINVTKEDIIKAIYEYVNNNFLIQNQ